ncbi:MAG: flagellar capping protein [Lachnospiraceae bacterium]|nr:flagellar capping protein [Lachnospiraceae bacterium]
MNNAILSNVYNHYLTTYAPKSTTQYDTHKKSELRSIYNSIVKLNKESPWYLDTKNPATQKYAVSLKENARLLHNTIASLGGLEEEQSLAQKAAYSSQPDSVEALYVGSPNNEENASPSFEITVNALATSQENMGSYLPDAPVSLAPDTYSFDIAINDLNYEFQFNINAGDTNKDVQERLVRLINNADIGIKARLDAGNSRSSIRLTSTATGLPEGKNNIFDISDDHTSKTSGVVDYLGLDFVSRQPGNSSFLLNGEERSTASNTFTLGKMFEVELKAVTPEDSPAVIGLKTDVESLTDNINTLIGGYNTFVNAANAYKDTQSLSNRLSKEMGSIAFRYTNDLEGMGIRLQSDNTISIDETLLHEAASGPQGINSYQALKSFAHALVQKTSQVSLDPMNYVNRIMVAYKNPGRNFASPYTTSAYSGMMFNSYC